MQVITTITETRTTLDDHRRAGRTVGLVPTMGSLHAGHLSLIERSVAERDVTMVSVFVNPLQFGPSEDFAAYPPGDLDRDVGLAAGVGADLVFAPAVEEMYPLAVVTRVVVGEISEPLEGAARPGHFDGVATVVAKLFSIVGPSHAYFGEKDYQQLQVITRMAADLSLPVVVVPCPIVREADGLALSSRNVYLNPEERAAAPVLQRALRAGVDAIERDGVRDADVVRRLMTRMIDSEPLARLEYTEVVSASTLRPVDPLAGALRLLTAARFGRARLIDNVGATVATVAAT